MGRFNWTLSRWQLAHRRSLLPCVIRVLLSQFDCSWALFRGLFILEPLKPTLFEGPRPHWFNGPISLDELEFTGWSVKYAIPEIRFNEAVKASLKLYTFSKEMTLLMSWSGRRCLGRFTRLPSKVLRLVKTLSTFKEQWLTWFFPPLIGLVPIPNKEFRFLKPS